MALNQELVEKERKMRQDIQQREEVKTFTPASLKHLLPPAVQAACNRNPILSRYQAFYPGTLVVTWVHFPDFANFSGMVCSIVASV